MAGIGFELKKVFAGNSLTKKAWGYSSAAVVVAGPTFLVIGLLIVIERISAGSADGDWNVLQAFITYSMLGALLTSSVLGQVLARYSADALYNREYDRVLPSMYGAYLLLVVPCGIIYGFIVSTADKAAFFDKLLNWFDWAVMTFVYIQLGYLTAIKKYRRLVLWFAGGIATALLLALLLVLLLDLRLITGIQLALFCGFGVMLCGNTYELHSEFPVGHGSLFRFTEYIGKYPQLLLCGFIAMAMSFSHIVIMWFGAYSEQVTGLFRRAPVYDAAAFYAFLVQIPTNVLFVVSMEVRFYERYRAYFSVVSSNGTLSDVRKTGQNMLMSLKNELLRIELIQFTVLLAYMALMRFYLATIGFTQTLLVLFFLLSIGYAAYGIAMSYILLLLYFDDRTGALLCAIVGFAVNVAVTLLFFGTPAYYGLGMTCGGIVMALTGLLLLSRYVRDIDEHVFCSQPIFAIVRNNPLLKFVLYLDRRALEKEEKYNKRHRISNRKDSDK